MLTTEQLEILRPVWDTVPELTEALPYTNFYNNVLRGLGTRDEPGLMALLLTYYFRSEVGVEGATGFKLLGKHFSVTPNGLRPNATTLSALVDYLQTPFHALGRQPVVFMGLHSGMTAAWDAITTQCLLSDCYDSLMTPSLRQLYPWARLLPTLIVDPVLREGGPFMRMLSSIRPTMYGGVTAQVRNLLRLMRGNCPMILFPGMWTEMLDPSQPEFNVPVANVAWLTRNRPMIVPFIVTTTGANPGPYISDPEVSRIARQHFGIYDFVLNFSAVLLLRYPALYWTALPAKYRILFGPPFQLDVDLENTSEARYLFSQSLARTYRSMLKQPEVKAWLQDPWAPTDLLTMLLQHGGLKYLDRLDPRNWVAETTEAVVRHFPQEAAQNFNLRSFYENRSWLTLWYAIRKNERLISHYAEIQNRIIKTPLETFGFGRPTGG